MDRNTFSAEPTDSVMEGQPVSGTELQAAMDRTVRDSLATLFSAVAIWFVLLIVVDVVSPPFGVAGRVTIWSLALGSLLGSLALCVSRYPPHERWAHPLLFAGASAVFVRLLSDAPRGGPIRSAADLSLFLMAMGCFVLSHRWLVGIYIVAIGSWFATILASHATIPWNFLVYIVSGGTMLGAIVHQARWKVLTSSELLRQADAATRAGLESARDAALRSEARFRRVFESEALGIIVGTFDGWLCDANNAFLRMMGYERSDLPLRWDQITPPEFAPLDALAVEQMLQTGRAQPFAKEYFRKDGTRVPILLGCSVVRPENREAMAFVIDLSSRRRAEEKIQTLSDQLEHAGRLGILGQTAVAIAHELNQPLSSIAADASAVAIHMENGTVPPADLVERLRMIASDAQSAAETIRRIKAFVARREVVRQPCDVNQLVDDALHIARAEARRLGVRMQFDRHAHLPDITVDGILVTRVILNLVLNGIQAASEARQGRPAVSVTTAPAGEDSVEITITDNGPGIPAAVQERMYRQFVTTRREGLGLGLAKSKSIVEEHAGQLTFETTAGVGTRFHVVLPRAGEIPSRPPSSDSFPVYSAAVSTASNAAASPPLHQVISWP